MFNLNPDGTFSSQSQKEIVQELYRLLDEYSLETYPAEHRNHLGVSVIGDPCSRKLWYDFRWIKLQQFPARMRRLFNRGHLEEEKFAFILGWMGFFNRTIDPVTNKQYNFSTHNGHYGGSGDTIGLLPWFRDDNHPRILIEYKTHNTKSFAKFGEAKEVSVKIAHPKHFAQMCGYGLEFNTKYALYCAINKDNDDIYFEFLELDFGYAQQLKNKAKDIIESKIPPPRISENPAYFECKYCDKAGICHANEPVEINCRSCKMAIPIENKQWKCTRFNEIIPKDFIKKGCQYHVSINT